MSNRAESHNSEVHLLTDEQLFERHLGMPGVKERVEEAIRIALKARTDEAELRERDPPETPA